MLSKFSVKKPMTVFVAVVAVIVLGIMSFINMTPDLMPNLDFPYAIVMTAYPGQSPESVEKTVTKPMEASMATLENIKSVSSTSSENYSLVVLEFQDGANMDTASVDIRGKIDTLKGEWPEGVGTPYLMKMNPNIMPVAVAAVDRSDMDQAQLSAYVEDTLLNQLEGIDGVASVTTMGILEESENVVLSQEKLDALNQKIENLLNDKFSDAEDQLNTAKQTLEDNLAKAENGADQISAAKETLAEKQKEVSAQLADASENLSQKQLELLQTKLQLLNKEEALTSQKQQMQGIYSQLEKLKESYDSLADKKEELAEKYTFLNELNNRYQSLLGQLEKTEPTAGNYSRVFAELEDIDEQLRDFGFTKAELPQKAAEAKSALDKTAEGMENIKKTLEELGLSVNHFFDSTVPEMQESIQKIDSGIAVIETTLKQLDAGQTTISEARKQLEQQESIAAFEMNSAMAEIIAKESTLTAAVTQLTSAEKEIDASIEDLREKKDAAKKAADVTTTVTMDTISKILTAQNFSMPAGYMTDDENQKYLVRVGNTVNSQQELEDLVLFDTGLEGMEPVCLSDVADVFKADNADEIFAKINGNNGVLLSFTKQSNYATAEVSDNIEAKFNALQEENAGLTFTSLMSQGNYIYMIVDSVFQNLIFGAVLAILILFLFLRDLKPTLIIACSIPISVVFAVVLMYFSGVTLNMVSLSGLAIGVGMLVDNSVVVIENIYRLRGKGVSPVKAAMNGARQVAGAITSSTLTTVCVFLPIVFVEGITRQLFTDMALTIAYSLLASLIVALTLVPAMGQSMFKKTKPVSHRFFDKTLGLYERSVRFTLKHRALALLFAFLILAGSAVFAFVKGFSFMPEMSSEEIAVTATMPKNSTFEDTSAAAQEMTDILNNEFDCFDTVGVMIGNSSSMIGLSSGQSDSSSIMAYTVLKSDRAKNSLDIAKQMEEKLRVLDCEVEVNGGSSMSSMSSVLGGNGIQIKLYGDDLDLLQSTAKDMAEKLKSIEGVEDADSGIQSTTPEIKIAVNKEKAVRRNLTVAQVYQQIAAALQTEAASTTLTNDGGEDLDVIVVDETKEMKSMEDIRNMRIAYTTAEGDEKSVRVSDIADITRGESMNSISREAQSRYITVSGTIQNGYTTTSVSNAVEKYFENEYVLPNGFTLDFGGANATTMEAVNQLGLMLLLGLVLIYLIMVAQFQSLKSPFIVMFTIPLACTGGFLGLIFTGNDVSVIALLGFVMLFGIIVNNGIVLVDYVNQLRQEGMEKREALVEAGKTRMRPILMTALTTVLGLLITAMGIGTGTEMMQPIAIVCIGGLLYGTLMTLYIVPVMYDLLNKKELRRVSEEDLEEIND